MSTITSSLLTADQFWNLPGDHRRRELIAGEVYTTMPPGAKHGVIASIIAQLFNSWNKVAKAGCVGVESGFVLATDPHTVRGPDVYFIRTENLPDEGIPDAFWRIAPDLAVEVVSGSDTASVLEAKVNDFLQAGTAMVWIVYPDTREVIVRWPNGQARVYSNEETLSFPELLPGFECQVSEFWGS